MQPQSTLKWFILACASAVTSILNADVKPNPLFSDGAVLQRGRPIPVWGTARDGEKVIVELADHKVSTTATDGKWTVNLPAMKEGGPFMMKISGDNALTINRIFVGEVWVCSGQSNMAWTFSKNPEIPVAGPKPDFPQIRMFTVTKKVAITPQNEAAGTWVECSPQTVPGFSVVGYYFARDLHLKLGIPIGMIHSSWGGTPAQAWTSLEGFGKDPSLKGYVDQAKKNRANFPTALAAYPDKLAEFKTQLKEWDETVGKAHQEELKLWTDAAEAAKKAAQPPPPKPAPSRPQPKAPPDPEGDSKDPTTLFNAMIAPIIPYGIQGVIWYQGESNAKQAKQYRSLFPALIGDWRSRWKQGEFPFFFVQIAPHKSQPPEIREAQFLTLSKVKNTAMAVTTDVGNANDIHPTKKEPVGQRLALAARALTYGEKIEYSGPLYESMTPKNGKIIISFKHLGGGLIAKGGDLKGFTIAGDDKIFLPAQAKIQGTSVEVFAEGMPDPKSVRYGWSNVPDVNLFNQEGLPASPFRTDVD